VTYVLIIIHLFLPIIKLHFNIKLTEILLKVVSRETEIVWRANLKLLKKMEKELMIKFLLLNAPLVIMDLPIINLLLILPLLMIFNPLVLNILMPHLLFADSVKLSLLNLMPNLILLTLIGLSMLKGASKLLKTLHSKIK
jgi:hypothetical protein